MNLIPYQPTLHRYAMVVSACTFILLLAGALVTSTGSSLAVPDWPLSFGKYFPQMTGGVLFEHGHRMIAGTVALLTIGLGTFLSMRMENRKWVRFSAVGLTVVFLLLLIWIVGISIVRSEFEKDNYSNVYFAGRVAGIFLLPLTIGLLTSKQLVNKLTGWAILAVLLQAALGGLTVLLHLPTEVSVAHAGLAQIFFSLIITLTLVTSRAWLDTMPGKLSAVPTSIPAFALATTVFIYLQIVVGAVTRHSGAGLAIPDFPLSFGQILPPDGSPLILLQFAHTRIGAFLVLACVNLVSFKVCSAYAEERTLFVPAATAALLVWMQCFLGMLVIFTQKSIIPTSVHVIVGATLLASMLILTLNSFRLFKKGSAS